MSAISQEILEQIYGEAAGEARARYEHLEKEYKKFFGTPEAAALDFFTAPGRTEIIGNHVDHNGGRILAASITMDAISCAAPTGDGIITILSEGYEPFSVDIAHLENAPKEKGTISLMAGIAESAMKFGYKVGGFNAYITSSVIHGAGVSSSAAFEMLLCTMINWFFNENKIDITHYALMGQYAENVWWNKSSGLMDQMACAAGGTILLDFSDGVKYEKVDFSFDGIGCDLIIVNTGRGHDDLSAEYSSMPDEMHEVARLLGGKNLCEFTEDDLLARLPELRGKLNNDRALLRAIHYYEECRRVDQAVEALRRGETGKMLEYMREGGNSSWKLLQNGYRASAPEEQSIPLMLALTEHYIGKCGRGTCRIHGGGIAGVIMAVMPKEQTEDYIRYMTPFAGAENIYRMGIRQVGAVHVG